MGVRESPAFFIYLIVILKFMLNSVKFKNITCNLVRK